MMPKLWRQEQLPKDCRAPIRKLPGTIHSRVTVEGLIERTKQVLIGLDGRGARGTRNRAGAIHHDRDQAAFVDALLRVNEVEVVHGRKQVVQSALSILIGDVLHELVAATGVGDCA